MAMARSDWKTPFLNLKATLESLYESDQRLYHTVLISPSHCQDELEGIVQALEPACMGIPLIKSIKIPTEGCEHHAHYYFGSRSSLDAIGRALTGIREWMRRVPKGLLSDFFLPRLDNQVNENLIQWTNLVYHLAWEVRAPYLQAFVEYQADLSEIGFFPWYEWPQPPDSDPFPFLINQGRQPPSFTLFSLTFVEHNYQLPDIIDGYLVGEQIIAEFVGASLTAIDVLVYMLESKRAEKSQTAARPPGRNRPRPPSSRKVSQDLILLKEFLRQHHDPDANPKTAHEPLTEDQIAHHMGWLMPDGKTRQSTVSRRMASLFGRGGMTKYRSQFAGGIPRGFRRLLDDGTFELEAWDATDEEEDEQG